MSSRIWNLYIGVVAIPLLVGSVSAQPQGMPPGYPGMYGAGGKPPVLASEITKPVELTDGQVSGFFAAMGDLEALGADAAGSTGPNPSKPEAFAAGLRVSGESMAILQKHGFTDTTDFQRVGYNVAMAYSVLEQGGKAAMDAELEKAEADQAKALAKMKEHLTPEQYKVMEQQLGQAMGTAKTMHDVPESNVELMKKYSEQMENLGKK